MVCTVMYSLQTASFSFAVTVYLVSQFNLQKVDESAFSQCGLMLVDQLYLILSLCCARHHIVLCSKLSPFSHGFILLRGVQRVSLQLERFTCERLNVSDTSQLAELKRHIPVPLIPVKKYGWLYKQL